VHSLATNFPTSLDNFTNPVSGNTLDSPSHSLQHSDANDAIEAIEAKLGVGASPAGSATAGQVLTISAAGTSGWSTPTVPGLVQVVPTSVAVGSGSGSVDANGAVTFSGASSISLNGIFTSTYQNYRILVMASNATSNDLDLYARLRLSGTDASGATDYRFGVLRNTFGGGTSNQFANGASTMQGGTISNLNENYVTFEVSNPYATKNTLFLTYGSSKGSSGGGGWFWVGSGIHIQNTAYDGITFFANGENSTGTIRVYGYRN